MLQNVLTKYPTEIRLALDTISPAVLRMAQGSLVRVQVKALYITVENVVALHLP